MVLYTENRMSEVATNLDYILGQFESVAWELVQEEGFVPRITSRDGNPLVVTRDYKTDRVNLVIEDNKVVSYHLG